MNNPTTAPSGEQHVLSHGPHRAVVASVGASLRRYDVDGLEVVMPYDEDAIAPAFAGMALAPWPNRLRDGQYTWAGRTHQVPVTEPSRSTALHGLVSWERWAAVEQSASSVTLEHVVVPTYGYPWPVRLQITYTLDDEGLTVRTVATNLGDTDAPYGLGFHPWLSTRGAAVDACTLRVDAAHHVTVDDRLLPTGTEPVVGVYDLREATPLAGIELDDAWTGPTRDADGLSWIVLAAPDGRASAMWADETFRAWQVCSGDGLEGIQRGAVAAEPMTCVADAFRTGDDLISLAPGASHESTWGLRLL